MKKTGIILLAFCYLILANEARIIHPEFNSVSENREKTPDSDFSLFHLNQIHQRKPENDTEFLDWLAKNHHSGAFMHHSSPSSSKKH